MLFDAIFPPRTWVPGGAFAHVMITPPEPGHHEWLESVEALSYFRWPSDANCYFGPALLCRKGNGSSDDDVLHATVAWAVVEGEDREASKLGLASTLPPTIIVDSGNGYHYYWLVKELLTPGDLRQANTIVAGHVQANPDYVSPGCLLRVPGTANVDDPSNPRSTTIVYSKPDIYVYSLKDILALERVNKKLVHIIRTGDLSDFSSELERDKYAIHALLEAGIDVDTVEIIFTAHQIGSVYKLQGWSYLSKIVDSVVIKAREEEEDELLYDEDLGIREQADGIYARARGKWSRVSTFLIIPELLAGNYLVVSIKTKGSPVRLTLPHGAFHSARALLSRIGNHPESVNRGWNFTGTDLVVKKLFTFLLQKAERLNVRKVKATDVLGRHGATFVLPECSIDQYGVMSDEQARIIYTPTGRERPKIVVSQLGDVSSLVQKVATLLPKLNKPEVIWPVLGWTFAALHKPQLEDLGWRFPFLCLFGIRGSGKTNLMHTIILRLLGYTSTGGTSSDTTRFVMLALLASSNALPVSFSEFQHAGGGADELVAYLKLGYDAGYDPRGRPDQTTIEYRLSAPVIVDGEESIGDSAARERMIAIYMSPENIAPGSDCFIAFEELRAMEISHLAEFIYRESLKVNLADTLAAAEQDFSSMLDIPLPNRVRRNYIVCWMGCRLISQIFSMEIPQMPKVMKPSVAEVLGEVRGGQIVADEFVEDLMASYPNAFVPHSPSQDGNIITIPLYKAYTWWRLHRRHLGDKVPTRSALISQLKERRETYIENVVKGEAGLLICINLSKARKMGLEVPEKLDAGPRLRTKKGGETR